MEYVDAPIDHVELIEASSFFVAEDLAELIDWDLLLIDEPFSSLDAYGKKIVNEKINNWKSQDKTISIILHDENTAKNFADRILKIRSGILENN